MQIRIGVRDVATEVSLETEEEAEQVLETVRAALADGSPTLEIPDKFGGLLVVPTSAVGYVQVIGEKGRVGFGRP